MAAVGSIADAPQRGFPEALQVILASEGGYVDHPADKGGATNRGVTQATYDRLRRLRGQDPRPVREIVTGEVVDAYQTFYWIPAKCDSLPWPASLVHFDGAVNHGIGNAARILQQALGVAADGMIGPATLAAVKRTGTPQLVRSLLRRRLAFYRKIALAAPSLRVFLAGWIGRILDLWDRCIRDMPEAA